MTLTSISPKDMANITTTVNGLEVLESASPYHLNRMVKMCGQRLMEIEEEQRKVKQSLNLIMDKI